MITALVPVLRDPKNRAVEPLVLFKQVGKKFGLTETEVQTIHSVHVEEAQRRIDALDEADRKRLLAKCGSKPERSAFDGGIRAVEDFAKKTAYDPDSIDVENCTEPTLSEESCWATTCEVRGKNAFGAKVLNRVRVSIVNWQVVSVL